MLTWFIAVSFAIIIKQAFGLHKVKKELIKTEKDLLTLVKKPMINICIGLTMEE